MNMPIWRRRGLLFVLLIFMFFLWNQSSTVVQAATPKFKEDKIEIEGTGEVYQLKIVNQVKGSTYKWTSLDTKIATVSKNGLVTSKNKGTTKIKCLITYASGKTKTLYCTVTVVIPATEIEINNAKLDNNNTHVMMVGETYDFNRTLTPSNSSDKTYWSLDSSSSETNPEAVQIDDNTKGIVTALRRGKIVLVATAARKATAKSAEESIVKDSVIIEVVGPSPEVLSAEIVDSKKIKVEFGTTIKKSTIIDSDGRLSKYITIDRLDDKSGTTAKDPGTLTGSLSSDLKTLTITAANTFDGYYGITFSNGIETTKGENIYKYYTTLNYSDGSSQFDTSNNTNSNDDTDSNTDGNSNVDLEAPKLASVELSDNGMTNIITFTEKMDFSDFQVSNARAVTDSNSVLSSTISYLNNKSNYIFTSDGKSIVIDLTNISTTDYNKMFTITISGLKDLAGNKIANNSIDVNVSTTTAPRAQARPISVVRTSYDYVTATFDRSIKTPGYAIVSGEYCYGEVNTDNEKQVKYKLSSYSASLSGVQTVSIGYWDSYNVISTDNYANQLYSFSVDFTKENIRPILISYSFNPSLKILTLTFSENVKLSSKDGYLNYKLVSAQYPNNNTGVFFYTEASTVDNVIEIMLNNITIYGDYSFTLPEGFVMDEYRNLSYSRDISFSNGSGSGTGVNKLAEPYSIYQSKTNHSFIFIEFADKLDVETATDITNYGVGGAAIEEAKLINNSSTGATIRLTLRKGALATNGKRRITISGLKGYNGSLSTMSNYSTEIELIENKDPELLTIKFNATTKNTIDLTFNEAIKGEMFVTVQERATGEIIGSSVTVSGSVATIVLDRIPKDGTYLVIYVNTNNITDLNGNESTLNPVMNVLANY